MEMISSAEFWASFNLDLFIEIAGLGLSCYTLGYCVGYKMYAFRRFSQSST